MYHTICTIIEIDVGMTQTRIHHKVTRYPNTSNSPPTRSNNSYISTSVTSVSRLSRYSVVEGEDREGDVISRRVALVVRNGGVGGDRGILFSVDFQYWTYEIYWGVSSGMPLLGMIWVLLLIKPQRTIRGAVPWILRRVKMRICGGQKCW